MKSLSDLQSLFTTISQNSSTSNNSLATILINDQHRYLLMKFFDNERNYTITTIGSTNATLTAIPAAGATSATLTVSWPNLSCQQYVVFNSQQRTVQFNQNDTKIYWQSPLATASNTTAIGMSGALSYPLPANVSKVKNPTITIGQLVFTPAPVQSIEEWTKLNALPYNSDIPAYFYVYHNKLYFWPIPSSTGNIISLYCQTRFPDLTYADYTTGTIATMTINSNQVTGSGTTWSSEFPTGIDLTYSNIYLTTNPPNGDGIPYQVQSFTNDTNLVLVGQVQNPISSGATYKIGQYPLLQADFHDAIVYGALRVYYNSIVKDPDRYQLYERLFNERFQLMEFYLGTKQVNVDLSVSPVQVNPNLYIYPTSSS